MKVLNVLLLVLLASSSSARVGSVQRALEPVNDTNPDEYLVIYDEGADDPQGLLKGLIMSGKAEILYNYTNIPAFAVKNVNLSALKNALKNVEGAQISTNDVATIDLVQSPVASWGLDRVDQMTGGLDLDDEYSYVRDGSNVDVYIIDTGIFIEHEDFGGRARLGADFTGEGNFDGNGHGSHVAGTVGGTKYGIAKNANLIAVKVLNSQGSGSIADIVAGIDWVVSQPRSNGAVINMSLGSSRVNSAMNTAVDSAVAAGVTVVVAGGNANKDACRVSPASATNVITVGATGKDDTRASFSNYGKCIDIFAPGVDITSVSKLQGSTWTISGTSMASPHVAGVAALLLDENSTLIPAQIADRIRADATPDVVAGAGRKSPNFMLYTGTITGLITTLNPTTTPVPTTPPAPTSAPTSVPSLAPAPSCAAKSQPCNANSDCCSNKCKGQNGFCRGN